MSIHTSPSTKTLYEQDYALWLKTTIEQLRFRQFAALDLDNLIEELEGMARSDRRSLESLLTRLWEHLLKITYWRSERTQNFNHWYGEITNFRYQLAKLLADSPSLKPYLEEIFLETYTVARRSVSRTMGVKNEFFPEMPIATREQILDDNWLPDNDPEAKEA